VVEAEQTVARAIAGARDEQARLPLVEALRVQAMVWIKQSRWAEAERALEEGLALARGMPYPYAEGRLLHMYGQMLMALGKATRARERLEAAVALFRRLGARIDVERVERAIAALTAVCPYPDDGYSAGLRSTTRAGSDRGLRRR
jgi:hypothetical protein